MSEDVVRIRVNIGTSVKGIITWDSTCELVAPVTQVAIVSVSGLVSTPPSEKELTAHLDRIRKLVKAQADTLVAELRTTYGQGEGYQPMTPLAGALAASVEAGKDKPEDA